MNYTAYVTELRIHFAQQNQNEAEVFSALEDAFEIEERQHAAENHVGVTLVNLLQTSHTQDSADIFEFPFDYTAPGETAQIAPEYAPLIRNMLPAFIKRTLERVIRKDLLDEHIQITKDITTPDPRNQINAIHNRIREKMQDIEAVSIVDATIDHINCVRSLLKEANSTLKLGRKKSGKKHIQEMEKIAASISLAEEILGISENKNEHDEAYRNMPAQRKVETLIISLPKVIEALETSRHCASRRDAETFKDPDIETKETPETWHDLHKWRQENAQALSIFKKDILAIFERKRTAKTMSDAPSL